MAATASGRLVGRIGERAPLIAGLIISGGAMLGLLRLQPGTSIAAIWWNFALLGLGIGLCGTPVSTIAMSAVEAARAGMASAVLNTLRQVGQGGPPGSREPLANPSLTSCSVRSSTPLRGGNGFH